MIRADGPSSHQLSDSPGFSRPLSDFLARPFFRSNFPLIFYHPKNHPRPSKTTQKGAKGIPIGNNFRSFRRYRWKFENSGFAYTKPSFSWFHGIPGDLFCSTLRTMFFNVVFATIFLRFLTDLGPKCPQTESRGGGPRTHFFVNFSTRLPWGSLGAPWVPLGVPWGAPGRQMTSKGTETAPK